MLTPTFKYLVYLMHLYNFMLFMWSNEFQKRTFFERYFRRNGKRNKVQKSESFLTEKTVSTECTLNDATENVILCKDSKFLV